MRSLLGVGFAALLFVQGVLAGLQGAEADPIAAAQRLGKERAVLTAQPDGLIVCEAEEFQVKSAGWQAKKWGENYYAATFANTFLSRKAFLGAPEQCEKTVAELVVEIPVAGRYLALARYEAAYRFETRFRIQVEQNGKLTLDRQYGARENLKVWAFKQKLKNEVAWDWGAVENVVWEGTDAFADLKPGRAIVRVIADKQPEPAAKRNLDLVMLTTDVEQVNTRLEKENYLPLDGMLSQAGDVFVKVHNLSAKPLTVSPSPRMATEHSPYWVHLRTWPAKVPPIEVAAKASSDWVEIGSWMDSMNDGQMTLPAKGDEPRYKLEFAVRGADGKPKSIATFETTSLNLPLAYHGDTRYSHLMRRQVDVVNDLLAYLKKQNFPGQAPQKTPVFGITFDPLKDDPEQAKKVNEFCDLYGLAGNDPNDLAASVGRRGKRGYIDVRSIPTEKLAEFCDKLGDKKSQVLVVSLGDEIGLPAPRGPMVNDGFLAWLRSQGVTPANVDPTVGADASKLVYNPDPKLKDTSPGLFYWSARYRHHFGIAELKKRTDILRQHLPNAKIGANFSPHGGPSRAYLGETFMWVNCFRDGGMTLPWGEDYIWQVPVGTQQMNDMNLDLFRAGLRGTPQRDIMYYCMPHWPGNTPNMWRRLFYGAIGHGMTMVNLFEFRPVQAAYTENHCTHDPMYGMILKSFRELGQFEDLVQEGKIRPGVAGLWFSEAADIWHDSAGSQAAAKRALHVAIRHQQLPLDIVVEQDALNGTLNQYKILYLTDAHISQAASKKIAEFVNGGGELLATAGAGMFDELNRPNTTLRELLGVNQTALDAPEGKQIAYIKQDLPFAEPIDTVTWQDGDSTATLPAIGVRSRIAATTAKPIATFADKSPAITQRTVGKGTATYCAFLPSLSYFRSAVPKRPVDRGSTDDAFTHFIPTQFDASAAALIALPARKIMVRPVTCSEPLVEANLIEAPTGKLVPLRNWSAGPVKSLSVTFHVPVPTKSIKLASGGVVTAKTEAGQTTVTLDLDVADALILR